MSCSASRRSHRGRDARPGPATARGRRRDRSRADHGRAARRPSLARRGGADAKPTGSIVTIFVNPTQFGPNEDFSRYPRTLPADCEKLTSVAADLVFAPAVEEMYPPGFSTTVSLEGRAKAELEDRFRPTHFAGVATVVAKLLNQAQADVAVFGEKDYQQLLVIRAMARDLDIPTRILGSPTLRDPDGLAMSSRNVYLSPEDRPRAPALHRALLEAAQRIAEGDVVGHVMGEAREAIVGAGFDIDYVEARHAETLARVARRHDGPIRHSCGGAARRHAADRQRAGPGRMSRRVVRLFVAGRVQGVGFRAFLIREANALALDGWARNRSDGSVEALAAGPEPAIAAFVEAARRGPSAARVDRFWETSADAAELDGVSGFDMAATL